MKILFMAAFAIITTATASFAEPKETDPDGNKLLHQCNATVKQDDGNKISLEEGMGSIYCLGYLVGFTDSHSFEAEMTVQKKPMYCLPTNGIKGTQLARVVTKYLKDHPKELHKSARLSVAVAITLAFPCPK